MAARAAGRGRVWRRALTLAMLLAAGARALPAQVAAVVRPDNVPQTPPPPPPGASPTLDSARAARGATLEVSLYTYGPGDALFERFGHIALAVSDLVTGEEIAFNWGMFDFDQPNFLGRFLTGDTRYWMAGYRAYEFNAAYQAGNRLIRRQRLRLTPGQRGAIQDYVAWNAREENRYYRYDYYTDNCSTRVRDLIDWALGGALRGALDSATTPFTWRGETARITADNLPVYAGIEVALGSAADVPLTRWQSGFLPERLANDLAGLVLRDGTRLVAEDQVVYPAATRTPLPSAPPARQWSALVAGLVVAGLVVLLARIATLHSVLTFAGTVWYLAAGLLGTALALLVTVTRHAAYAGHNLSLFQMQPLLLVAGALWWARSRPTGVGRAARIAAGVCAITAVVGLVAQHLPTDVYQHNTVVWMFAAPVHLALGVVAHRRQPAPA